MTPTMERVIFKTLPGTTDEALLAAAEKTSEWIKAQPGFGYRTLVKEDDGQWVDLVFWMNAENAKAANESFSAASENATFMSLIDMESVKMTSHAQHLTAMGGA